MHVDRLENILNEFSTVFDSVKPLCRKIRKILFFLLKNEALFKKISSNSSEKLYDSIIESFDNVIANTIFRQKSK